MPLSDLNVNQLKTIVAQIEQTGTEYAEIHLIYKRPWWRHLKIVQGETLEKDCGNDPVSNLKKEI